jgi:hypothetical protein
VLFAVVAVEIFATQSRLPATELYHPVSNGLAEGAYGVLSFAGFVGALVALGVLPIIAERVRVRTVVALAAVAGLLAATILWPGAIHETDLDTSPAHVLSALGAALTVVLTIVAARRAGTGQPWRRQPGDLARIVLGVILVGMALPWMAADLGLSLNLPGLRWLYQTDQLRAQPGVPGLHQAVHDGHHHGMNGVLLAIAALVLSRGLPYVRLGWLRHVLAGYLAFLLAYGLGNTVQDFWLEQIVKRGLTSFELPMVLTPAVNWGWAAVLLIAIAVYLLAFRSLARSHPRAANDGGSAGSLQGQRRRWVDVPLLERLTRRAVAAVTARRRARSRSWLLPRRRTAWWCRAPRS